MGESEHIYFIFHVHVMRYDFPGCYFFGRQTLSLGYLVQVDRKQMFVIRDRSKFLKLCSNFRQFSVYNLLLLSLKQADRTIDVI